MFRTRTSRLTATALCLVAAGAPLMGAGPDERGRRGGHGGRDGGFSGVFGGVTIRIGEQPRRPEIRRVEIRRVEEVLPCDLRFSAYQSRDTVIIVATGTNRGTGFQTGFQACNIHDRTPELRLMNTSRCEPCGQVTTAFEVSSSFHTRHQIGCIKVIVAGRAFDVHVVQTPCL